MCASAEEARPVVYTIGHSTRSEDEFIGLLRAWEIETLVDVRGKWPYSRHNPQFNKDAMEKWIVDANVWYEHLPKLGGWQPKQGVDPDINGGWRRQGMKNYADYTLSEEFEQGVEELLKIADYTRVAYMCAEAVPWRCHRLLLSNVLVARGYKIRHIMSLSQTIQHQLGQWGAMPYVKMGKVTYPGGSR